MDARSMPRRSPNDTYLANATAQNLAVARDGRTTYETNLNPVSPRQEAAAALAAKSAAQPRAPEAPATTAPVGDDLSVEGMRRRAMKRRGTTALSSSPLSTTQTTLGALPPMIDPNTGASDDGL